MTAPPMRLAANGWGDGVAYTKGATFTAMAMSLDVAPDSSGSVTRQCPMSDAAKFWRFSTHTHSRATNATVSNGANVIVSTSDWRTPAVATFYAPDFYQFGPSDQLSYSCSYANNQNLPLVYGTDYATQEHCDAIGYFFPAGASPAQCWDDSEF
jgi:hypothetical protein